MSFTKSVEIEIDQSSWPSGQVPASLTALLSSSPIEVDVKAALLFTGVWTRPPLQHGFHLSDRWAWLRYFPAIADVPDLRLCEPWESIDPHQKTILSDDFGVGFSTWLLHKHLGVSHYADTIHVVKVLNPKDFSLIASQKHGPAKSPDFVGFSSNGDITVVECKGSQSSRKAIRSALDRGVAQKANLQAAGGTTITHSLVTGLFIPQWVNPEAALFAVRDPDLDIFSRELVRYEPPDIRRAITQVAVAKELALFDLPRTPGSLVHAPGSVEDVGDALDADLSAAELTAVDALTIEEEYIFPGEGYRVDDTVVIGVRFTGVLPLEGVEPVRDAESPRDAGEALLDRQTEGSWTEEQGELAVTLVSPIGARYRLEMLT